MWSVQQMTLSEHWNHPDETPRTYFPNSKEAQTSLFGYLTWHNTLRQSSKLP